MLIIRNRGAGRHEHRARCEPAPRRVGASSERPPIRLGKVSFVRLCRVVPFVVPVGLALLAACGDTTRRPSVISEHRPAVVEAASKQIGEACRGYSECFSQLCLQVTPGVDDAQRFCSSFCPRRSDAECPVSFACRSIHPDSPPVCLPPTGWVGAPASPRP